MTHRYFFTKAAEHIGIFNLTRKSYKSAEQPKGSDHLLECNCSIDLDQFNVLVSAADKFRLLVKESLFIKCDEPQLKNDQIIFC